MCSEVNQMRHSVRWGLPAALLVAVIATGTMLWSARAGEPAAPAAAPLRPEPTPVTTPAAPPPMAQVDASATEVGPATAVGVRSGRLSDLAEQDAPAPVALTVAGIGIAGAPVDPVGVEPDGGMEIPTDVSRIGWYRFGPEPGAAMGTAVLTAHIDDRTQGRGVFYDLDGMDEGDGVEVRMSDGSVRRFTVDEIQQIPKVDLPTGDLFRRDGAPRLALITCGGEFDAASRHYRDNIVVLASPAG
jgi:hypothetical protein